jgi:hypothetical protein
MGMREAAARAKLCERIFQPLKLFAILACESDGRLDAFLPFAVQKQPFLRAEAQESLVPNSVVQHSQLLEQLADVTAFGPGTGT